MTPLTRSPKNVNVKTNNMIIGINDMGFVLHYHLLIQENSNTTSSQHLAHLTQRLSNIYGENSFKKHCSWQKIQHLHKDMQSSRFIFSLQDKHLYPNCCSHFSDMNSKGFLSPSFLRQALIIIIKYTLCYKYRDRRIRMRFDWISYNQLTGKKYTMQVISQKSMCTLINHFSQNPKLLSFFPMILNFLFTCYRLFPNILEIIVISVPYEVRSCQNNFNSLFDHVAICFFFYFLTSKDYVLSQLTMLEIFFVEFVESIQTYDVEDSLIRQSLSLDTPPTLHWISHDSQLQRRRCSEILYTYLDMRRSKSMFHVVCERQEQLNLQIQKNHHRKQKHKILDYFWHQLFSPMLIKYFYFFSLYIEGIWFICFYFLSYSVSKSFFRVALCLFSLTAFL